MTLTVICLVVALVTTSAAGVIGLRRKVLTTPTLAMLGVSVLAVLVALVLNVLAASG